MMTLLKKIKLILTKPGDKNTRIKYGIAKDINMIIDSAHQSQRIYGLGELEIAGWIKKFIKKSSVLIDVGSNVGFYSLVFRKHNKMAKIISCEPVLKESNNLKRNFELNNYDLENNFELCEKFVSDINDENNIQLDLLLKNCVDPLLIKMDIDGGEYKALKGAGNILRSKECYLVIETHSLELEKKCMLFLDGLGYKTRIIDNAWWRFFIPEQRPIAHNRWFIAHR